MAKTKIIELKGKFTCVLSNGRTLVPISPGYEFLTQAKIFRKAFELGRENPEPLYSGFDINFKKNANRG